MINGLGRKPFTNGYLIFAIGALLYCIHVWSYLFINDDAYISFRYAAHWADFGDISYNLGERVEGYTNFLWVALLAAGRKLSIDIPLLSYALSFIFGLSTLLCTVIFTRLLETDESAKMLRSIITMGLLVMSPSYTCWTSGGLEVQLFTACFTFGLLFSVYAWNHEQARVQRGLWAGSLMALAALTRPEGVLLFVVMGLYRLSSLIFNQRRPNLVDLGGFLSFIFLYTPYFVWRYQYYGHMFPNTYYAKVGAVGLWTPGTRYVMEWLLYHPWLICGLIGVGVLVWNLNKVKGLSFSSLEQHLLKCGLLCGSVLCIHVARVGGDFMALHRFLVPLLPIAAILSSRLFLRTHSDLNDTIFKKNLRISLLILTMIGLPSLAIYVHQEANRIGSHQGVDSIGWLRQFSDQCAKTGQFINQTTEPHIKLATTAAGALPFYAERYTIDLLGLNDEWIAHQVPAKGQRPGHTKSAPFRYPIDQGVEYLVYHPTFSRNKPRPSLRMERALKSFGYHWKSFKVSGLTPPWWSVWIRNNDSQNSMPTHSD